MKFIDLFAGIGGFRIALEENGQECVFSSEIDSACVKVYEHNFHDTPHGDIKKIEAKDIPDFDILAGGFPCQPFSYAGKKEGFNDQVKGTLFFDVVRILKEKRPKMFILENVKGIKAHDHGRTLNTIYKCLEELGYTFYDTVFDSHDFGLPQYRERWYCVGFLEKIPFEFPKPFDSTKVIRDIIEKDNNDPSLKLTKFEQDRIARHFAMMEKGETRVQHDNSAYGKNTKKGKYGVYSYLKKDGTLRFHVGDHAKSQIQEAYYCCLDSVAPAIIATREPKMWDLSRRLSVTECKRLQGFPEWFEFNVSDLQAKKQLGNAISVPVVRLITKSMLDAYENYVSQKKSGKAAE